MLFAANTVEASTQYDETEFAKYVLSAMEKLFDCIKNGLINSDDIITCKNINMGKTVNNMWPFNKVKNERSQDQIVKLHKMLTDLKTQKEEFAYCFKRMLEIEKQDSMTNGMAKWIKKAIHKKSHHFEAPATKSKTQTERKTNSQSPTGTLYNAKPGFMSQAKPVKSVRVQD